MRCRTLLLALAVLQQGSLPLEARPSREPVINRDNIRALVVREARDLGVDPALALAVAHAESFFDPKARSHMGAIGVMQIMPATARGEYALHPDILWDARINIRLGLHFLRRLLARYAQSEALALSYYNGGSAVGDLPRARVIPATRGYVEKVLRLKHTYRARLAREGVVVAAKSAP